MEWSIVRGADCHKVVCNRSGSTQFFRLDLVIDGNARCVGEYDDRGEAERLAAAMGSGERDRAVVSGPFIRAGV